MVNSREFTARLDKILDYYELNASSFAEAIDVGRSSISHIISGRNKPSLDFVMKVVETYDEVDLYWLLNGKGSFPKQDTQKTKHTPSNQESEFGSPKPEKSDSGKVASLFSEKASQESVSSNSDDKLDSDAKVLQKVILLYSDGSFESFDGH